MVAPERLCDGAVETRTRNNGCNLALSSRRKKPQWALFHEGSRSLFYSRFCKHENWSHDIESEKQFYSVNSQNKSASEQVQTAAEHLRSMRDEGITKS